MEVPGHKSDAALFRRSKCLCDGSPEAKESWGEAADVSAKRKAPMDANPTMGIAPSLDESWPPAFEPFVDADTIAKLLMVKRKTVLDWARRHVIPAHPFGQGKRTVWRFRLSEIASHKRPVESTIGTGSPEIARLERKHG